MVEIACPFSIRFLLCQCELTGISLLVLFSLSLSSSSNISLNFFSFLSPVVCMHFNSHFTVSQDHFLNEFEARCTLQTTDRTYLFPFPWRCVFVVGKILLAPPPDDDSASAIVLADILYFNF